MEKDTRLVVTRGRTWGKGKLKESSQKVQNLVIA